MPSHEEISGYIEKVTALVESFRVDGGDYYYGDYDTYRGDNYFTVHY